MDWLYDGKELAKLEKLFAEVKANPTRSYSRYHVKNPDGTIYRKPTSSKPRQKPKSPR